MAHKVKRDSFADKRRGSRHERGYGTAWDRQRQRILRRDAGICQACVPLGLVHVGTEVDHIVPRFEGGSDDDSNLQTICTAQHRAKTQAEAARARGATVQPPAPPQQGRGGQISTALTRGTDRQREFFGAGVLVGGGSAERAPGDAGELVATGAGAAVRPGGGA